MKTICPISGFSYRASELFEGPNEPVVKSPHPIFSLSSRQLLARARKYKQGNYSTEELTLLFLSTLNRTNLVRWEVPAEPGSNTVLQNLDSAYKTLLLTEQVAGISSLHLPTYTVTPYNSDLSNIHHFFSAVFEAKKDWEAPNTRRSLEELLETREMILWKQIHSSSKKTPSFYKRLAYWCLDCIGIDAEKNPDKREDWARILQVTEPAELFLLDREEFFDMYSQIHSLIKLPGSIAMGSGYTYSQEVLKHINWQRHIFDLGPTGYMMEQIGGPSHSYSIKKDNESEAELQEELQQLELRVVTEDIPLVEPKRLDFPTAMEWLRAKGKWTRTQTVRDKLHIVRTTLEAKKKMEEIRQKETDEALKTVQRLREELNFSLSAS